VAAEHATVAAEAALPEPVADERHRGSAGAVLVVGEEPAELRPTPSVPRYEAVNRGAVQRLGVRPSDQVDWRWVARPVLANERAWSRYSA